MAPPGHAAATRTASRQLVTIKFNVGVAILLFLLHVQYASKFKAPGHTNVFPGESLVAVPDDKLIARLRLIVHQMFLRCQVTVTKSVSVLILANVRQVNKQISLVIVQAKSALLLLYKVHQNSK